MSRDAQARRTRRRRTTTILLMLTRTLRSRSLWRSPTTMTITRRLILPAATTRRPRRTRGRRGGRSSTMMSSSSRSRATMTTTTRPRTRRAAMTRRARLMPARRAGPSRMTTRHRPAARAARAPRAPRAPTRVTTCQTNRFCGQGHTTAAQQHQDDRNATSCRHRDHAIPRRMCSQRLTAPFSIASALPVSSDCSRALAVCRSASDCRCRSTMAASARDISSPKKANCVWCDHR